MSSHNKIFQHLNIIRVNNFRIDLDGNKLIASIELPNPLGDRPGPFAHAGAFVAIEDISLGGFRKIQKDEVFLDQVLDLFDPGNVRGRVAPIEFDDHRIGYPSRRSCFWYRLQ